MDNTNDKKKKIEEEVQRTLQSLDNIEDIEVGPHFFAAIHERIEATGTGQASWLYRVLMGYRLAPAILGVFIILNVVTAFWAASGSDYSADDRQTSIEAMADEYSISGIGSFSDLGSEQEF